MAQHRFTHIALAALTLACNVYAQAQDPVIPGHPLEPANTLPLVVEKAVTSHPEIQARYHDFASSLEGQNIARAGWRPQVTAQGWVGREWRSNIEGQASYDWSRPGWNLNLRQLIFDGGITSNNIKQWGFEKLAGYYDLLSTIENLAAEATNAYVDVQRYREMQALAQENYELHATTLNQIRERQESGVGRGVDLEQASGRLALAQTNMMTESNNLNDVTQRYLRLVGEYPASDLTEAPDLQGHIDAAGTPQSFEQAVRQNPSLLAKYSLVQAAQAGEKSAKGAHAPLLELRAGTGRDRNQPDGTNRHMQSSYVQLLLTYNLYRGGADQARVRQTAAQAYAAKDVAEYTCRNIQQELSIAWNNIVRLRQQMPFLEEHELSTSKVKVAYQQQFHIGQRSLLDLLDTENELFDARRALINARYDLKRYEYRWLSLSNQLLSTLGLATPRASELPSEAQSLIIPDESLRACMTGVPDTQNLAPITAARTALSDAAVVTTPVKATP